MDTFEQMMKDGKRTPPEELKADMEKFLPCIQQKNTLIEIYLRVMWQDCTC